MSGGDSLEKRKGPERGQFTMSTFKKTFDELSMLRGTGSCNELVIEEGIDSINLLIEKGPQLRGMGLRVMEYVDSALHQIYPKAGSMDIPEIKGLLEEEREILERIRDKKEVSAPEMQQVITFFHFMWDQLEYHESGKPPTVVRKTPE